MSYANKVLSLIEICAGLSRGSYLVCIGWTTLVVTGDVAKVGQVFVASMLAVLLGSHLVGTLVDRCNKKLVMVAAHLMIAAVLAAVGWALAAYQDSGYSVFLGAVVIITLARSAYEFAFDATIKRHTQKSALATMLARFRTVHLLCTAAATVAVGWVLSSSSTSMAFYLSSASSVVLALVALFLPPVQQKAEAQERTSAIRDFSQSVRILKDVPQILSLVLLAGLALAIGQLSNAILSSYIYDVLGMGSWEFGLVDGAWPIGGLLATLTISFLPEKWTDQVKLSWVTALCAMSTISLALSSNIYALAILHGGMGFFVWLSRILVNARVLEAVSDEFAGRAQSNISFFFSAMAIIMCLTPSFLKGVPTQYYFIIWASAILVASAVYEAMKKLNSKKATHPA